VLFKKGIYSLKYTVYSLLSDYRMIDVIVLLSTIQLFLSKKVSVLSAGTGIFILIFIRCQRPNSWTKFRQKSYEFSSLVFTFTSTASLRIQNYFPRSGSTTLLSMTNKTSRDVLILIQRFFVLY
jgi:hypothetical protein